MLLIAIAGKPNCGKSTFFKSLTLANVEIANYPFTTIDPNKGVAYVRSTCPCKELGIDGGCGNCVDGIRFTPVELLDVAGLVPNAHLGKGLGNQFLDNLREADGSSKLSMLPEVRMQKEIQLRSEPEIQLKMWNSSDMNFLCGWQVLFRSISKKLSARHRERRPSL